MCSLRLAARQLQNFYFNTDCNSFLKKVMYQKSRQNNCKTFFSFLPSFSSKIMRKMRSENLFRVFLLVLTASGKTREFWPKKLLIWAKITIFFVVNCTGTKNVITQIFCCTKKWPRRGQKYEKNYFSKSIFERWKKQVLGRLESELQKIVFWGHLRTRGVIVPRSPPKVRTVFNQDLS